MKKILLLVLLSNYLFSIDIYKEIKIHNDNLDNISYLNFLGIDIE